MESAHAYTAKGVKELAKANEYQKKSRKKMCIILICVLVVLAVILGPTLASATRSTDGNVG